MSSVKYSGFSVVRHGGNHSAGEGGRWIRQVANGRIERDIVDGRQGIVSICRKRYYPRFRELIKGAVAFEDERTRKSGCCSYGLVAPKFTLPRSSGFRTYHGAVISGNLTEHVLRGHPERPGQNAQRNCSEALRVNGIDSTGCRIGRRDVRAAPIVGSEHGNNVSVAICIDDSSFHEWGRCIHGMEFGAKYIAPTENRIRGSGLLLCMGGVAAAAKQECAGHQQ